MGQERVEADLRRGLFGRLPSGGPSPWTFEIRQSAMILARSEIFEFGVRAVSVSICIVRTS